MFLTFKIDLLYFLPFLILKIFGIHKYYMGENRVIKSLKELKLYYLLINKSSV